MNHDQIKPPTPASRPLDVLAVGNAIVDVLAHMPESFIDEYKLQKGHMQLIDQERATTLYDAMAPAVEISGGSAANTVAGVVSMGGSGGFIGTVASDQLGEVFAHDLRSTGVKYETPKISSSDASTARSLIVVTPDSQRTMNTYLGAASAINENVIDEEMFAKASVIYLEGYLFDLPRGDEIYAYIANRARENGCQIALTLSDPFVVDVHRERVDKAIDMGIELIFCNKDELSAMFPGEDFDVALKRIAELCPYVAVTRGPEGSVALDHGRRNEVNAHKTDVVDTTGAGDMYAAGFLYGYTHGKPIKDCAKLGSLCASEIISHLGARPDVPLAEYTATHS